MTAQNMEALAQATEIRSMQGQVRRDLAELSRTEARRVAAAMLLEPSEAVGRQTAGRLLRSIPGVGRRTALLILRRAGLLSTAYERRISIPRQGHGPPLTERERKSLAESLRTFGDR